MARTSEAQVQSAGLSHAAVIPPCSPPSHIQTAPTAPQRRSPSVDALQIAETGTLARAHQVLDRNMACTRARDCQRHASKPARHRSLIYRGHAAPATRAATDGSDHTMPTAAYRAIPPNDTMDASKSYPATLTVPGWTASPTASDARRVAGGSVPPLVPTESHCATGTSDAMWGTDGRETTTDAPVHRRPRCAKRASEGA